MRNILIYFFLIAVSSLNLVLQYISPFSKIKPDNILQMDTFKVDSVNKIKTQGIDAKTNIEEKQTVNYIERTISVLSLIATVISTVIAVQQSRKVKILRRQKHRLTWDDIEVGINQLFKEVEEGFKPDLVICLSERGAAVMTMGFTTFGRSLPIISAFWQHSNKSMIDVSNMGFIELYSRNRAFYIPNSILQLRDKKILIIDDWVFTGQAMLSVYGTLKSNNMPDDNIRCAALVTTPVAKTLMKPNPESFFYYYEFPDSDFYFPWGKAS